MTAAAISIGVRDLGDVRTSGEAGAIGWAGVATSDARSKVRTVSLKGTGIGTDACAVRSFAEGALAGIFERGGIAGGRSSTGTVGVTEAGASGVEVAGCGGDGLIFGEPAGFTTDGSFGADTGGVETIGAGGRTTIGGTGALGGLGSVAGPAEA
jgi:hypothetical protein